MHALIHMHVFSICSMAYKDGHFLVHLRQRSPVRDSCFVSVLFDCGNVTYPCTGRFMYHLILEEVQGRHLYTVKITYT